MTDPRSILPQLELIRAGLSCGIISKNEIIDWSLNIISADPQPDIFFIELALLNRRNINDIIQHFSDYLRLDQPSVPGKLLLGLLYRKFQNKQLTLEETVRKLYLLKDEVLFIEMEEANIYSIEDALDLATQNIHGDFDSVRDQLTIFLKAYEKFSGYTLESWQTLLPEALTEFDRQMGQYQNPDNSIPVISKGITSPDRIYLRAAIFTIVLIAIYDIAFLQFRIAEGYDVFMPALFVVPVLVTAVYSVTVCLWIDKNEILSNRPLLGALLLIPMFINFLVHTLIFLGWIYLIGKSLIAG